MMKGRAKKNGADRKSSEPKAREMDYYFYYSSIVLQIIILLTITMSAVKYKASEP